MYEEQEEGGSEAQHTESSIAVPMSIKIARLYYLLFLIKRSIMILVVVLIPSSVFTFKISLLLILQIVCILYAFYVRSFENKKDQIVEELNEIAILVAMAVLANNSSEGKWTNTGTFVFIGVILMHSWILFIVSVTTAVVNLNKYLKKRKNPPHETNFDQIQGDDMINLEGAQVGNPILTDDQFNQEEILQPRNLSTLAPNAQNYQNLFVEEGKQSYQIQGRSIL